MYKYFISTFLLLSIFGNAYEYNLSICATFCQDDLPYMREWIDFHHKQGVEHFYLYSDYVNKNEINKYLNDEIKENLIEIQEWNYSYNNDEQWTTIQLCAYMDCSEHIQYESNWCVFIDTDEFLFSPKYGNLNKALDNYSGYTGVVVNLVLYGTSNYILQPGEKLTDHLIYRQKIIPGKLEAIKPIIKPRYVSVGCIHRFDYTQNYSVNENYQKIVGYDSPMSCEIFRINHYCYRDKNFMLNYKIPRQEKYGIKPDQILENEKKLNDEYDDIIKKYN